MSFTDAEKVDIRRYCGFPAFANFGWVYVADYGTLEQRMNGMTAAEEAVVRTNYLVALAQLEADLLATRVNLDTAQASVWTHNAHEQRDRENLMMAYQLKLCGYFGIKPGPALSAGDRVIRC